MRAAALRLALALVAAVAALAGAELVLRLTGFEYRPLSIEAGDPEQVRRQHMLDERHFVYDPDLIWRPRAGYEIFNAQGLRGPVMAVPKPAGDYRIVALGDSNTLGWAGDDGANWPAELGRSISAIDPGVVVANAGVWGYSSFQGTQRLTEVLDLEPDLVLVSFGANDAHLVPRSDRDFAGGNTSGSGAVRRAVEHLRSGQLLIAALDRIGGGRESERVHRVGLEEYRANLHEMVARVRAAGGEAVLMTRPFIGSVRSETWWKRFAPRYNLATAEVAAEAGAPIIDLYSFFKYREDLFADESHFTAEGHRLAAELVLVHLRLRLFREGRLK